MKYKILIFSLFIALSACQEKNYKPNGLTKLSHSEIIERVKKKDFPNIDSIVYKNENGQIITLDSIKKIPNIQEWTADSYADKNGVIREIILRKATEKDKLLQKEIQKASQYQPPIELVDIDCEKVTEILQNVFDSDQGVRTNGGKMNPETDRENLTTVISLIEKCGMPTLQEVNDVQMSAIWVVFQHGDNANRKKYLPLLEKSAKSGDLKATQIAMMKDRTMMNDDEPQVYGTQVTKNGNEWVLYELASPETVNKRRAEMGFEPLQDYLKRWNIEFNIKQSE
ncbi:hypothetical protein ES692_17560 [Psychroserpens burtonensis]|uniref:Lipoprotein n=1 Tax=Psychroserpens burtonensis TaxID=49278 RepID=A0A5C7B8S6_9FLAO|nr:DUF6624 domain-containing protein [Psychroserpens burtonensis]TXE14925.1 hypothetical protein ES692_17560 [Psychroserpens burtonensis]